MSTIDVSARPPVRVLHIVESIGNGAVENWLMRMAAFAKAKGIAIDWTFYCQLSIGSKQEDRARALGIKLIRSPVPISSKILFLKALREVLSSGGYQVLHSHHDIISGFYFFAATGLDLKKIVHVHNAYLGVLTDNPLKKALYRRALHLACFGMSDLVVANSSYALNSFLLGRASRYGLDLVHYLGVDPSRFEQALSSRIRLRRELSIDPSAVVFLFAARLSSEKNPLFALAVFAELKKVDPCAVAIFAGSGGLATTLYDQVHKLGLESSVFMIGWSERVPEIMCASDIFILPASECPVEAFGLAVVEAQLAGLRLLLSNGVLDDPLLPSAAFRRLPLAESPNLWARAAIDLLEAPAPSPAVARDQLQSSPMNMDSALDHLLALYA